ncbi:MAG: tetratricopeptide repeat protein [Chloroflexi bacterium]|nr:tetratricopeptide repeat protein [Chloroflexota bacterium]
MIQSSIVNPTLAPADPDFINSLQASLAFWQKETGDLTPEQLARLDERKRNLFRAVKMGLLWEETWQDTAVVAWQSFDFVEWRGLWQEWIPVLEKAIGDAPPEEAGLKARLLNRLGQLYAKQRYLAAAQAAHEEASALAAAADDPEAMISAYLSMAELLKNQHQYDKAELMARQSLLEIERLDDNTRQLAFAYSILGNIARLRGDLIAAEKNLRRAVQQRRLLREPVYLSRTLNDLGIVLTNAGRYDEAAKIYKEATAVLAYVNDESDKSLVLLNLGVLYYRQGKWAEAEMAFRRIDTLALAHAGEIKSQALTLNNLGNVLLKNGKADEAIECLREAISLWREMRDEINLANSLGTVAELLAVHKDQTEAVTYYEEAIAILQHYPNNTWACKLLEGFTDALTPLCHKLNK